MSQIIPIVSEALQASIRRLLPSQNGFGEDLQASNVIIPVIDLTPTAEGSQLDTDLARANAFGSNTVFESANSTVNLAATPGFYKVICGFDINTTAAAGATAGIIIDNGLSNKIIFGISTLGGAEQAGVFPFEATFFLDTGETLQAFTNSQAVIKGSYRQIADRYGNITNPVGFTFE